jgi:hypothetical protein
MERGWHAGDLAAMPLQFAAAAVDALRQRHADGLPLLVLALLPASPTFLGACQDVDLRIREQHDGVCNGTARQLAPCTCAAAVPKGTQPTSSRTWQLIPKQP